MSHLPEFLESVVLLVASGWLVRLYRRVPATGLLFAALFLLFPAFGLMFQVAGASHFSIEATKWVAVCVDVALTLALVWSTWHEGSPASRLLAETERLRAEMTRVQAALAEVEAAKAQARSESSHDLGASNCTKVRQLLEEVSSG